eukprot:TRINITY_DN723_c0_g3_i5.p1 TRINITY_DN723_c0_g3~~TRINITY_DN723_c0_g3_i5.p1  ORF type:complete len:442 (-),score=75.99 TRINITY_DN723_c0_g3_i5:311-1636(-)
MHPMQIDQIMDDSFAATRRDRQGTNYRRSFFLDDYVEEEVPLMGEPASEGTCSTFQALLNMTNAIIGPAFLSIPYAFSALGWSTAIMIVVLAIVVTYTAHTIGYGLSYRNMRNQRKLKQYADVGEEAYGLIGRHIVNFAVYFQLFSVCSIIILLIATVMEDIVGQYPLGIWIVITTVSILPLSWFWSFQKLSFFSFVGVLSTLVVIIMVGVDGFVEGLSDVERDFIAIEELPIAAGIVYLSLTGHAVLPSLYTSMKDKADYHWVVNTSYSFVTVLYLITGVLCYVIYGNRLENTVIIEVSNVYIRRSIAAVMIVALSLTYSIYISPIALVTEGFLQNRTLTGVSFVGYRGIIVRCIMVLLTGGLGFLVTDLERLISIIGYMFAVLTSLVFPCLFYLVLRGHEMSDKTRYLNIILIIAGILTCLAGIVFNIADITDTTFIGD